MSMDLHALADFNLVATHGGFGRASRQSGRSKATLSRKVSELEASLGVRLIDRGSHTLRLTDEGRALHQRTQGPLAEIAEAREAVAAGSSEPRGKLRISAPIVLAHVLLPRAASAFVAAYPQVEVEIVAEDRKVDPVEDNYDIVIRVDPDPDERLIGRRIVEDDRLLVGPADMAVTLGEEEQAVPAVVHPVTADGDIWRIETGNGISLLRPQARLRFSSFLMVRDAVLAGAGVAIVPSLLVSEDLAAGRLRLWGRQAGPKVEIWALQNSRRLTSLKVRTFVEALGALV
jgi:DNA-binding transcriptional LysR family regulator